MTVSKTSSLSRRSIYLLVVLSGFATLSWEVIWQIKSTLALGVSAWGTAITLAITMSGLSIGGYLMGRTLRKGSPVQALCLYGLLESIIGLSGLFLNVAFGEVEKLDTLAYAEMPDTASLVHVLGIVAVLGVPTICMGATLPVFGLIAEQFEVSITELYGLNTLGAATGVLFAALALIPLAGITHTTWAIAAINIAVGFSAWLLAQNRNVLAAKRPKAEIISEPISWENIFIVFVTGFATFTLEIAWFRSLAATFPNTTDVFATMLASVLIALGLASRNVSKLKKKNHSLGTQICLAGILILLATPLIEHLDMSYVYAKNTAALPSAQNYSAVPPAELLNPDTFIINWNAVLLYASQNLLRFVVTFCLIAPPIQFLGVAFPWIIENQKSSHKIGNLYAVNTFAAIVGAIGAAWVLLPTIGFARTAWIAGVLVVATGILIIPDKKRLTWAALGIAALLIAVFCETGVGRTRVQGAYAHIEGTDAKILGFFEGPEATVSVVEYDDGGRRLIIDSSSASGESGNTIQHYVHYMAWMGHLPMLLEPDPKNALVICFGTGQTANAVRKENIESLDIVDINPRIFKLAHNFRSNENVLNDPKVKAIVMDGRAYMRRTTKVYDVITLEPMPPSNAGVNALYSKEFYELARKRLSPKGVIAQWLPFHAVSPRSAASIAKTFMEVFPNAILWIDPVSNSDGILLGTNDDSTPLATTWPGFSRIHITRNLSQKEVEQSVVLNKKELERYSAYGEVISDDNQLLAYGTALYSNQSLVKENFELLHRINNNVVIP